MRTCSFAAFVLLLSLVDIQADDSITLGTQSSATKDHKHILVVSVLKDGAVLADSGLTSSNGANPLHGGCFVLRKRDNKGSVVQEVEMEVIKATGQGIEMIPKKAIDLSNGTWSLLVRKGCVTPSHTVSNHFDDAELAVDPSDWIRDEKFLKNNLPENKVSLKQGSKTGIVSFNASFKHYFENTFSDRGATNDSEEDHDFSLTDALIQGNISVDASIRPSEKGQYLNNIEGQLGGYVSGIALNSLTEIGFSTKTQADQKFEKIDQTGGLNVWMWLNQTLVDNIARAFFLYGERPPYQDHPLLIAGYDYVGHVKGDSLGNRNYDGQDRLSLRGYWSIPLARGIDLRPLRILDQSLDVDFIADIKGTYDVEDSSVTPEINLSLDLKLSKVKVASEQPSISFSYVDGRAAPKFEHFDAFLAGFKMPF